MERDLFSLVSTIEELLETKNIGSGPESREYGHRDPSLRPRNTIYPQNVSTNFVESGGRSVGIVRSRTQTTEFSLLRACTRTERAFVGHSLKWHNFSLSSSVHVGFVEDKA
jgi:hypothetical protein